MYGLTVTVCAVVGALVCFFYIFYRFGKDLINEHKQIKYETKYCDELEKNMNGWNKGVK